MIRKDYKDVWIEGYEQAEANGCSPEVCATSASQHLVDHESQMIDQADSIREELFLKAA